MCQPDRTVQNYGHEIARTVQNIRHKAKYKARTMQNT